VLFGLLIDKNKNPICYHIYSGDTWEGHTFEDIVKVLKQTYQIDKVIIVADRGMLNSDNLKLTTGNGYEFIVGERLKNLPAKIQKQLINPENYTMKWEYDHYGEQITINYFTLTYKDRIIIGTYSKKRAGKDAHEREQRISKAYKLLKNPSTIKKKAKRYYLKNTTNENYEIDDDKIKKDELYDGYLAISTSLTNMTVENILDQYRHLFQVEHSFRTFKSYLETRPMFHWTDKRIEGHIALCYIAYAMLNNALQKLSVTGIKCSETELRNTLNKMQLSLVQQNKRRFYIRSNLTDKMDSIIKKLGVRKLPHLFPKEQLTNYLG
jgi:transposase